MKLIIDIPEEDWEFIKESDGCRWSRAIIEGVINGTPLPEHHGRLGDLDALRKEISSWGMNDYEPSDFIDEIDMADVIIEADRAESEDKE